MNRSGFWYRLNVAALLGGAIIALVFLSRFVVLNCQIRDVKKMVKMRLPQIDDPSRLEIQNLDWNRQDFLVSFKRPPFQPLHWTVNRLTGEVMPWDSEAGMKRVIRDSD